MNKKLLKSTLAVAMVAVAGYGGYKAYDGYAGSERGINSLLTENVEALSGSEFSGTITSECGVGEESYAESYVKYGSASSRSHIADSTDWVVDISIIECSAYGIGKKDGSNFNWPIVEKGYEAPCLGAKFHNEYLF